MSDTIAPTAICKSTYTAYLNQSGIAWVNAVALNAQSTDNCGIEFYKINNLDSVFVTCTSIGTVSIPLAVIDSAGNTSTCTTSIAILDTLAPLPSCQNITVNLSPAGTDTIVADDLDFFSIDNCAITNKFINGQSSITYDCDSALVSPFAVTLSLYDASGNESTCQSIVTIKDNTPPVVQCKSSATVYLDTGGEGMLVADSLDNGSTDNCGYLFFEVNGDSVWNCNCSNIGVNTSLVFTAVDVSSNTGVCMTQVQVLDTIPPIASCKDDTVYINTNGNAAVSADDVNDMSMDNCGIDSRTFASGSFITNFTCSDLGTHSLTLVVADVSGNSATCPATVTVLDTLKPVIACNSQTIDLTTTLGMVLTPGDVGVYYDNCTVDTAILTPSTYTCNMLGVHTYTLTVTDESGNSQVCTNTVTVSADAPSIIDPTTDSVFLCVGDTIQMTGNLPNNTLSYTQQWMAPYGQISSGYNTATISSLFLLQGGMYYFSVTPIGVQGCTARDSFYLYVDSCLMSSQRPLSVEETTAVVAFPNPASDYVTISLSNGSLEAVELWSLEGKLIRKKNYSLNSTNLKHVEWSVKEIPTGGYWLKIRTSEQTVTEKLIIQD